MTSQLADNEATRPLPAGVGRGPGGHRTPAPDRCPVPSCRMLIDPSRLMCSHHWYLVPKPLRDRVWATWRSGDAAESHEHRDAVLLAVSAAAAAPPVIAPPWPAH